MEQTYERSNTQDMQGYNEYDDRLVRKIDEIVEHAFKIKYNGGA